jgi:hypothetical protein
MHEVQVDIVEVQVAEGFVEGGLDAAVVGGPSIDV